MIYLLFIKKISHPLVCWNHDTLKMMFVIMFAQPKYLACWHPMLCFKIKLQLWYIFCSSRRSLTCCLFAETTIVWRCHHIFEFFYNRDMSSADQDVLLLFWFDNTMHDLLKRCPFSDILGCYCDLTITYVQLFLYCTCTFDRFSFHCTIKYRLKGLVFKLCPLSTTL